MKKLLCILMIVVSCFLVGCGSSNGDNADGADSKVTTQKTLNYKEIAEKAAIRAIMSHLSAHTDKYDPNNFQYKIGNIFESPADISGETMKCTVYGQLLLYRYSGALAKSSEFEIIVFIDANGKTEIGSGSRTGI